MSATATLLTIDRRTACNGLLAGLAASLVGRPASALVLPRTIDKSYRLDSGHATYAFGVDERGWLQTLYWGAPLADGDPLPPALAARPLSSNELSSTLTRFEYAGFGGGITTEPALKIKLPNGTRDLDLRCIGQTIEGGVLRVHLRDIATAIDVRLSYEMDEETGIIVRSAIVENNTKDWIEIDQMAAGNVNLPAAEDYTLHYLAGRWAPNGIISRATSRLARRSWRAAGASRRTRPTPGSRSAGVRYPRRAAPYGSRHWPGADRGA